MFRYFILASLLYCSDCFFVSSAFPSNLAYLRRPKSIAMLSKKDGGSAGSGSGGAKDNDVNVNAFNNIDVDKSGKLDISELEFYYGKNNYMDIADVNNDGEIDYLEFDRLSNIKKFGVRNGGNLFVRNAINFGFLDKNSILADGEASVVIGNKGFDPLNCSTSISTLRRYREAEIKHGRLAMLGSVGWPLAELYHPYLSKIMNGDNLLTVSGKVPSLLNGGLGNINPVFFMAVIIFATTLESASISKNYEIESIPGDLGFDPLNIYTTNNVKNKRELELKELNNGRIAMLAITYFAINEFITDTPIANSFAPIYYKLVGQY